MILIYLIIVTVIPLNECKLTIHNEGNLKRISPVISNLPWDTPFSTTSNYHLVSIDRKFEGFNPCDEKTFTPASIQPLLDAYQISDDELWVAVMYWDTFSQSCDGSVPLHMYYTTYASYFVQQMGGDGYFQITSYTTSFEKYTVPPDVNVEMVEVYNKKINIPGLVISQEMFLDTLDDLEYKTNENNISEYRWSGLFISEIAFDENLFSAAFAPFGFYQLFCWLNGIFSVCLTVFTMKECNNVIKYYRGKSDESSNMALFMRMLILLPLLITGCTRILSVVDPIGVYYMFDFYAARLFVSLTQSVSLFVDIVTIFYCYDIYHIFKASRNMKSAKPMLLKYRYAGTSIITGAFLMIILETTIVYFGLRGSLGDTTAIPALYTIIVSMGVVGILLNMSSKMKREVTAALSNLESKTPVSSTKGLAEKHQIRIEKTKNLLRMRKFVLLAAYTRIVSILSTVMAGSGWYSQSALQYCITILLMFYSNIVIAFAQILAATQLPSERRQVKTNSIVQFTRRSTNAASSVTHKNNKMKVSLKNKMSTKAAAVVDAS